MKKLILLVPKEALDYEPQASGPVREKAIRGAIKSPGGKTRMAAKIIGIMPKHRVYVESHLGGGAVFFKKPPSPVEVLNDMDPEIMALYRFLQNGTDEEFKQFLAKDWKAKKETWERLKVSRPKSLMGRAYRTWYVARFGWTGDVSPGAHSFFRTSEENKERVILTLERLQSLRERLSGVELRCQDGVEVIEKFDSPETLVYADPPYLLSQRSKQLWGKRYEWNERKQARLLSALSKMKGKFILSQRKLTPEVKAHKGWHFYRVGTRMTMGSWGNRRGTYEARFEYLITNFPLRGRRPVSTRRRQKTGRG